ncbi:MAG: hypothetical protein AB7O49_05615 [Sphingomonadales bacterium]
MDVTLWPFGDLRLEKGSLAFVAWVCARLGGWTGYYGKPGPVVMLEGWLELQAAKRAINRLGIMINVSIE